MPTKPGHPAHDVYVQAAKIHNTILCLPTWQEILQYEYVRQRGELNMITDNVPQYAARRGLYALVEWYDRCRSAGISPLSLYKRAIDYYSEKHGPRSVWIDDDVKAQFVELEIFVKEHELKEEMRKLRALKKKCKR